MDSPDAKPHSHDTLPTRVLRLLAESVYRNPRLYFYPQVLLFVACIYYTATHLKLNENRNDLVGSDKKYHRNFLKFKAEFPGQDDLVAVVESEDLEKNRQFVERLGQRLVREPALFTDVMFHNDLKMMGKKALLFFSEKDLADFQKTLGEFRPFLETFSQATNLDSLLRLVNRKIRTSKDEKNAENAALVKAIPALERIIAQASDSIRRAGAPPSPGVTALFDAGDEALRRQYITFNKGRMFIVTAHAVTDETEADAVRRLRQLVLETQREVPGVNVAVTGEPVLDFDEMNQSQHDSTVATVVSLVLCALIFIYGYQETGRPIKATFCLIIGLAYTMGYTTLVVGHLNILTITFVPMLIGIAIDFGVHLISRYEEELRHGRSEREALEKALVNTGQGVFTGCFTTAGAFFAMALTDFKGIQEMGIITGGGMIICLVPMVTILPVLLLRGRQNQLDHLPSSAGQERRARIENLWLERPKVVLFVTAGLCLFCLARFPGVYFDYNLLHMQSAGLPAVVFEKKLVDTADKSVLYAAVVANSLPEAIALEAKLTNLTTVAGVDSMAHFLAEDQTRKLALIGRIKQELASLNFAPLDTRPVNVRDLSQTLTYLDGYATLILEDVKKRADDPELLKSVTGLKRAVQELAGRVANGDRARASVKLAAYQQALFQDIHDTFSTIKAQDNSAPLQPADLPAPLRNRFIGITGKHLLQVNPKKDVWQRENQEAFITEVRTVDPEVTGTPVQLYEYTGLLKDSYIQAAWYALGAIVILVFLHFRSPATVLLSLLPVAIGTIWMVGFMGWTGIPFNPANIMTLPLVIGIGVTNGIHILNRYAEEKNPSILAKSTGKAVFVSALTTIAGFGSLILAKHQGIQSLGAVMAVGTATCMVASLTFLPALLNLTGGMSKQKTQ